jgi:hypothetical protein
MDCVMRYQTNTPVSEEVVMADSPAAELPIGVPEADLLEQRATIDSPEPPEDEIATSPGRVTDTMADEGDLLEQAQAVGTTADDDRPYEPPSLQE